MLTDSVFGRCDGLGQNTVLEVASGQFLYHVT
jgi:hypothetical protein